MSDIDDLIDETLGELDEDAPAPVAEAPAAASVAADLGTVVEQLKAPDAPGPEQLMMQLMAKLNSDTELRSTVASQLGLPEAAAAAPADDASKLTDAFTQLLQKTREDTGVDKNVVELVTRFEEYMWNRGAEAAPADRARWTRQLELYRRIATLSAAPPPTGPCDNPPEAEVLRVLAELQHLGDPPDEVGDLGDAPGGAPPEFLQQMAAFAQAAGGSPDMEKMLEEMAPEMEGLMQGTSPEDMEKMMADLMGAAPPEAKEAVDAVEKECKQQ